MLTWQYFEALKLSANQREIILVWIKKSNTIAKTTLISRGLTLTV